jgi:hypothetical protein
MQVSQSWSQPFRMTLYPGMFSVGGLSPGLYTGVRGNDFIVGPQLFACSRGAGSVPLAVTLPVNTSRR